MQRITPEDVEASIATEHYFNASNCAMHPKAISSIDFMAAENFAATKAAIKSLELLTLCVLVLKNGFTVTGECICISPENFDAEICRNIARQDAMKKIWPLLGYQLKDTLHRREQLGASEA